jgi:hypothetical protein
MWQAARDVDDRNAFVECIRVYNPIFACNLVAQIKYKSFSIIVRHKWVAIGRIFLVTCFNFSFKYNFWVLHTLSASHQSVY